MAAAMEGIVSTDGALCPGLSYAYSQYSMVDESRNSEDHLHSESWPTIYEQCDLGQVA